MAAEALAMRKTVLQAAALGLDKVIFKSNAQLLIQAIMNRSSNSAIYGIVEDILLCAQVFKNFRFIFISRVDNIRADQLAKQTLKDVIGPIGLSIKEKVENKKRPITLFLRFFFMRLKM